MSGKRKGLPVLITVIVILVAAFVVYLFLHGRGSENDTSFTIEGAYKVGQEIDINGIGLTVLRSYESNGTDSERPLSHHIFTVTRVSLTNGTEQQISVKPEDFTLTVDGEEIPIKSLSYIYGRLDETSLEPGASVEGAISWETPTKPRAKYLTYHGIEGQKAVVDLLAEVDGEEK